jgi:hypothetical protein
VSDTVTQRQTTSHLSTKTHHAISSPHDGFGNEDFARIPFPVLPSIPSASIPFPAFRSVPIPTIAEPASSQVTWPLMPSTPPPSPPTISLSCVDPSEGHHPTGADDPSPDFAEFGYRNSPYATWQTPAPANHQSMPPMRSNCSLPSACYSRSLSRSGARAPEPDDDASHLGGSGHAIKRMSGRWRTIQQHVNVNVRRVTKSSFDHLKRPFRTALLRLQFTCGTPANLIQQASQEHVFSLGPRPAPPSARARRRSGDTFGSRDLDAWLTARRRLSMEGDDAPGSMLSIVGVNTRSSWTNRYWMAANPICGVPGCALPHPAGEDTVTHGSEQDVESSWSSRRFDTTSRRLLSHSSLSAPSTPRVFAVQPRRSLSVDDITLTKDDTPRRESAHTSRRREMSIPRGWVFGV